MRNVLVIISILGIILLGILGSVEPSIPSSLRSGGPVPDQLETPYFPD